MRKQALSIYIFVFIFSMLSLLATVQAWASEQIIKSEQISVQEHISSSGLVDIPCLLTLAHRYFEFGKFEIHIGCHQVVSSHTEIGHDQFGRINRVALTGRDENDTVTYEGAIDIERDQFGRVGIYTGTVSGLEFPSFVEVLSNEYDEVGQVCGVDVTKTYSESNDTYTMLLQPCQQGLSWSGYRVSVTGGGYDNEAFEVGTCTRVIACAGTPTISMPPTPEPPTDTPTPESPTDTPTDTPTPELPTDTPTPELPTDTPTPELPTDTPSTPPTAEASPTESITVDVFIPIVKFSLHTPSPTSIPNPTTSPTEAPIPGMTRLRIVNDTGDSICYEVLNAGIGQRCFPPGSHDYGSFTPGNYSYSISADCGSDRAQKYYSAGEVVHRLWCGRNQ